MEDYIKQFVQVIKNCSVDNTYKMAWAKALVELSCEDQPYNVFRLSNIAQKMFKYYWNQTIYFDLIQGSNLSKPPEFISEVKAQINSYFISAGKRNPIHFERVEDQLELNLSKLVRIIKQDVSWRFLNLNSLTLPLYSYKKNDDTLILDNQNLIAKYAEVLNDVINFRWTQILENFNSSPRIAKKVRIIDQSELKRTSLTKFRTYLDQANPNHTCFICGNEVDDSELSIDHVIPWSFMFSDDLWNLVYTHKSCNSSKSNQIPTEEDISKLEIRNNHLIPKLQASPDHKTKKQTHELEIAIERDFVRKFYVSCKS